jgi:hypothetical protein
MPSSPQIMTSQSSKHDRQPNISGRSRAWLKFKNPGASVVKREAEEDWSKQRWR